MMPIRVMPICTVDRNLPGSAASASAVLAAPLLFSAAKRNRFVRAETIASSDIEKTPLSRINPTRIARLNQGNGDIASVRLADLPPQAKGPIGTAARLPRLGNETRMAAVAGLCPDFAS